MKYRIGVAVVILLASAFALRGQVNMYRIQLNPSGHMVSLDQPNRIDGKYVFHAWPDGAATSLKQSDVRNITQLTGPAHDTIYQIELVPSGTITARDNPTLRGSTYTFHTWQLGTLMSLRVTDVSRISPMTGDRAFWIEQGLEGGTKTGNLAMQGMNHVVEIGTPAETANSSQAGPRNLNSVGSRGTDNSGISGAPAGNWTYEGQPGVADAWGPANATVNSPGDVPTMPAATNGGAPPQ
jgi:hypothetical protein